MTKKKAKVKRERLEVTDLAVMWFDRQSKSEGPGWYVEWKERAWRDTLSDSYSSLHLIKKAEKRRKNPVIPSHQEVRKWLLRFFGKAAFKIKQSLILDALKNMVPYSLGYVLGLPIIIWQPAEYPQARVVLSYEGVITKSVHDPKGTLILHVHLEKRGMQDALGRQGWVPLCTLTVHWQPPYSWDEKEWSCHNDNIIDKGQRFLADMALHITREALQKHLIRLLGTDDLLAVTL